MSDAESYEVDISGTIFETQTTSLDISHLLPNTYTARVRAIHATNERRNSAFSGVFNFTIERESLNVLPNMDITIEKIFDGTDNYSGDILPLEHYTLDPLRHGNDVDITITSVRFNSENVATANALIVNYSAMLTGSGSHNYTIESGYFRLHARILPREIEVAPTRIARQFGSVDNLNYSVICDYLGMEVPLVFQRQAGEEIGFYNLTEAISLNSNFIVSLAQSSGLSQFEITRRYIDVVAMDGAFVSRAYDGTADFGIDFLLGREYVMQNLITGFSADITVLRSEANSKNVLEANLVTVFFSFDIIQEGDIFRTLQDSFTIEASITPRQININPNSFSKEFGDDDLALTQAFYDSELGNNTTITFTREVGEAIGFYDLTAANSSNPNYEFNMIEGTEADRFSITRRTIEVLPTDIVISRQYDGTINYNGVLEKNLHYIIYRELEEFEIDIVIVSVTFDNANAANATVATVQFSVIFSAENDVYTLANSEVVLNVNITPRQIIINPTAIIRQYGDADDLSTTYFDIVTGENVGITFTRTPGDQPGFYNILSAESDNPNFVFTIENGENKFEIIRRQIYVTAENIALTKVFDNTNIFSGTLTQGVHYTINNIIAGEETEIEFTVRFNRSDVSATGLVVTITGLTNFTDRYELITAEIIIPATITPRQRTIIPNYFTKQFGDPEDMMRQSFTDAELGLTFYVEFSRTAGNSAGAYDITGAISTNPNYTFTVLEGEGKFIISPRILGVEIIGNPTFTKVYDGTTMLITPIIHGFHYNFTNLAGGTNASLNIVFQEFDSPNVLEASRVIVRYTALVEGGDGNFVTTGGTMVFNGIISPRPIAVTPEQFTKRFSEGLHLGQDVLCSVTGETIPATFTSTAGVDHTFTDAGTYDITDIHWDNPNFALTIADGAGTGRFIIERNFIQIFASDRITVFNGTQQGILPPTSYPAKALRIEYSSQPINAGVYVATIIFDGDNNFYPAEIQRTLIIERAASTITNLTPANYVYDGTTRPIVASLNHNEQELVFSRNDFRNAGTHTALVSVPQSTNFRAASLSITFTIAQKVLTNDDILLPTASNITFGQYLYSSALIGGSTLGTFAWANGLVRPLVSDTGFNVIFTPNDPFNNNDWSQVSFVRNVPITVNRQVIAATNLTFPSNLAKVHGQQLSAVTLPQNDLRGTFVWTTSWQQLASSGFASVTFLPFDNANFDWSVANTTRQAFITVSFPITLNLNGGTAPTTTIIAGSISSSPIATRPGFVFEGWFTNPNFTENSRVSFPFIVTGAATFHALWRPRGIQFTENAEGTGWIVSQRAAENEQRVIIPTEFRGLQVVAIAEDGFANNQTIRYVFISSAVTIVGTRAFDNARNLAEIEIDNFQQNINFGANWSRTNNPWTDIHFTRW